MQETAAADQTCSLLAELNRCLEDGGPQERLRILRRVTDVFMAGARTYSDAQVAVFDEVLTKLASDIEKEVRVRLAQKMAGLERAPRRLVRSFAFDPEIDVAAPVLIRSRELSDPDLVENARTMSQSHLLAIAQRVELSESVTDALIARGRLTSLRRRLPSMRLRREAAVGRVAWRGRGTSSAATARWKRSSPAARICRGRSM